MNINWKQYVDYIYCISCEQNKNRHNDLIDTLTYANIINSDIFKLIISSEEAYNYDNLLNTNVSIYSDCIKNNYNRILILEDDIRILKDESIIINHLNNIPNDFDICLLDYQIPVEYENKQLFDNDNELYFKYNCYLYSTAAYIITLDACKKFITHYEKQLFHFGMGIDVILNLFFKNKWASKKNLFIQYEYKNRMAKTFNTKKNYLERNKIDLNNYHNYNV